MKGNRVDEIDKARERALNADCAKSQICLIHVFKIMCQAINNAETREGMSLAGSEIQQSSRTNRRNRTCVCVRLGGVGAGCGRGREGKRGERKFFTISHLSDCRSWQSSQSQKSLGQTIRKARD